jgi:hypothetical protein
MRGFGGFFGGFQGRIIRGRGRAFGGYRPFFFFIFALFFALFGFFFGLFFTRFAGRRGG